MRFEITVAFFIGVAGCRHDVELDPSKELPVDAGGNQVCLPTGYCIDRTEVTRLDYARFLAQTTSTAHQPEACLPWNDSFVPTVDWPYPPGTERFPVTSVDWCDAYAYCAWAGGRLCGRVSGGALAYPFVADNRSQWYAACSHEGTRAYPYGTDFDGGACYGDPFHITEVMSEPACEGGYPGIFDMVGNAGEWEDACAEVGADANCRVRGSITGTAPLAGCDADQSLPRQAKDPRVGFRCCGS